MNKLFTGVFMIALLLLMNTSCKKVLDIAPYDSLTDVTTFTSPDRIEGAVNGVYDAAQSGFYIAGAATRGYPFGSASIEQGDMRGEDMLTYVTFYQFTYEASYNLTTANNDFMFQTLYGLINKANLTIEGVNGAVSKGIISSALGNEYVAECLFLRALAHHELLLNFSRPYRDGNGSQLGIIYRDFGVNSDATSALAKAKTRTTVADGYAKVLADLDVAETNLPVTTAAAPAPVNATGNKTFRATKAAAIALKMRVRLHMGDWLNVIAEGNKIVPTTPSLTAYPGFTSQVGGWKLETSPATPFTTAGWQGNETIFSIRNASGDAPDVNSALASMHGNTTIGGRGVIRISPIVYNLPAFRCDDLRRNMMAIIAGTTAPTNNYVTTKYFDATTRSDPAPLIRYAEVLLTLAEAEARQNGITPKALYLLNEVRNRALPGGPGNFTTPPANTYTSFANANALIKAILDERRIEFIAEGKRWGDIHRNATDANFTTGGIPAKIGIGVSTLAMYSCGSGSATYTTAIAAFPYSDYRFLWPIPLSETQANTNYAQNPGW